MLDFDTLDQLKARAKERRVDVTRCAYEGLQEWLGMRTAAPADSPADPAGESPAFDFNRAFAPFHKPKGNA